ncbi:phosphatases II [Thozetella sp. PMI_491]|nr:phosphatases II [Thozetella sp. PMI_491]
MTPLQPFQHTRLPHGEAAAPFSARPPSPPPIIIPTHAPDGSQTLSIVPSFIDVDSSDLNEEDLSIITRGRTQSARDGAMNWQYESRRQAQPVLDFLYVGPYSAARDREWLAREGITMVLVARDTAFGQSRVMPLEKNCGALGIAADYIDIAGKMGLVAAFPVAVKKINDHMLEIYRSQAVEAAMLCAYGEGNMAINEADGFRRGKVLVCCESGNDRSPAIVAAYILSVFGVDLLTALQFVIMQRFCVSFDEETKHLLQAYYDIVSAKRDVTRQKRANEAVAKPNQTQPAHSKRHIDDAMMEDEMSDVDATQSGVNHDIDRYLGRAQFAPFVDRGTNKRSL